MTEVRGEVTMIVDEAECGLCRRIKQGIGAAEAFAEGWALCALAVAKEAPPCLCKAHDHLCAQKMAAFGMGAVLTPKDTSGGN